MGSESDRSTDRIVDDRYSTKVGVDNRSPLVEPAFDPVTVLPSAADDGGAGISNSPEVTDDTRSSLTRRDG
jgi:hypothetical protein